MRFSVAPALVLMLATAEASSWFSKAAYNKWHETELERWLSDHDVKYPTPSDRKDLENLVKTNWQSAVESPYSNWDTQRMQKYLEARGQEVKKETAKNKDSLLAQVRVAYQDTADSASNAYGDVKSWIFDSWTESQLKSFCDKHGIPVPQPRKRDNFLRAARENYQSAANKIGETAAYPGNWLYESWSDSDLKSWLDQHGIPAPQPNKRDKLIASVRRNAYLSSKDAESYISSASASAASATAYIGEELFNAWSDSKLKEIFDKNGIKVPQGSTRNELLALARKNAAKLTGDNISNSAVSAFGAATSSAGNSYASASSTASKKGNELYDQVYSGVMYYVDEALIAAGIKTNYASSASRSASSVYAKATKGVKGEL